MDSQALLNKIETWLHLKTKAVDEGVVPPPLPEELFSVDQMERHGITLALSHELVEKNKPDILLARLSQSEETLIQSCAILTNKDNDKIGFSPAREWFLDNFYLIQEQIYSIRRNLPKGYGRMLPQLAGNIDGYPRIYDIASQIIIHSDGRWDLENLHRFIEAYQSISKLTLGELWATPITLGVALIENLSNASKRIVTDRNDRNLATFWADQMINVVQTDPKKLVIVLADMARSEPSMSSAFVAELARRLQGATLALPISWIEQHLAEEGYSIEQKVQEQNKLQAANQVTISNCISGLRHLTEVNWRNFVENVSVVEKILQRDPTTTYAKMDFNTRDRYRHVVEGLSRRCHKSEYEVALAAIELANINTEEETKHFNQEEQKIEAEISSKILKDNHFYAHFPRECHVGHFLIDQGISQLEARLQAPVSLWIKIKRFCKHNAFLFYVGSILLITFGFVFIMLWKAHQGGVSTASLIILGLIFAISGSQLAIALVNLISTLVVKPRSLPKMDFTKEIPSSTPTLVIIPTLLGSINDINSMVEALEVRYLGNRVKNVYFGLLTDFNDSKSEHEPNDELLLKTLSEKIVDLNKQYSYEKDVFFLFHRPRQWNEKEQRWMGRERKRGKLSDLNDFLKGKPQNHFSLIVGETKTLESIKYVVTLDSDTQLPRDTIRFLVGTIEHPLNRAIYDEKKERVIAGHSILQPRVAEALPDNGPSRYVWLCGNEFGVDPYTRTVSDVYQDLFDEGSFIGKGIYDLDMFQKVLSDRFPDNRILSHDLLEGCYLRSGFISDVPLYEKSPNNYLADVKRRVRWIRGDWQIASWIFPIIKNGHEKYVKNTLSFLSRLKIFDNLRRSLVALSLVILLGLSWTILPQNYFWLAVVLIIVLLPPAVNNIIDLLRKPRDMKPTQHVYSVFQRGLKQIMQILLYLTCLPHEAWYSFTAILKTLWRLIVSKKHLLEWTPSDQASKGISNSLIGWFFTLWAGPVVALLAILTLILQHRIQSLIFATPLLLLWFFSPLITFWLSRPFKPTEIKLSKAQIRFLHRKARMTWSFFETFITKEDHWLPPDNFQETPVSVVARRTSPTNIGLALLANLTAYDFGYITMNQLLERTKDVLESMSRLERYRGHFYNWYSTETLSPLMPRYVSSVDSGNLSAHLLTLRQGLLELTEKSLLNTQYIDGIEDVLEVLETHADEGLKKEIDLFKQLLNNARLFFNDWQKAFACCNELHVAAEKISTFAKEYVANAKANVREKEILEWSEKLVLQTLSVRNEIELFAQNVDLSSKTNLKDIIQLKLDEHGNTQEQKAVYHLAWKRLALIKTLELQAFSLAQMDMSFLVDEENYLMTIGFNVDDQRRDPSNYDLLSSEARLGCFVAIAQGQLPQDGWFSLGRLLAASDRDPILISWSGSMFEYLMPLLVMPSYPGTLLDQSYRSAINRQIAYGKQRGVPWGISESGFNAVDTQYNYLYRAFGVPGLGLKRGLEEDLVIAPYATAMALMVDPKAACINLERLVSESALGKFGFYEAVDYTQSRLPPESRKAIVRSFMTHHQGMTFLSFSHLLHNQPMQKRFAMDPIFQATLLLLQERVPKPTATYLKIPKSSKSESAVTLKPQTSMRTFTNPNTRIPQVQLLSNGRYHMVLTQAGGGYSRWKEYAITRWREDTTCDRWGLFSYIRDLNSGEFWSTTYQPTKGTIENFKAIFSESHAEFTRTDFNLDMHAEIVVSPEDDIELRRLRIHNRSKVRRTIEFTSYAEIVLAPQLADLSQPAFSNLFVETEILPELQTIIATRRPQNEEEDTPWACHLLNVYSDSPYAISFETDRDRFIGRGRTLAAPLAMVENEDLSNTMGAVLDPIFAIRCRITLEPDALVIFDLLTGVTNTRDLCIDLINRYQDRRLANRIFGLAWTHGQVLLHQLNISEEDAQLFGKIASSIVYVNNSRRAEARVLASNRRGQSGLWGYSISGDLPIVLIHIEDESNLDLVRKLIQAQSYWRQKGLIVDLIILNEERISYRQTLQDQIMSLITSAASNSTENSGAIVVRVAEQLPTDDYILFQSVARVIFSDKDGTLKEQVNRQMVKPPSMPLLTTSKLVHDPIPSGSIPLPKDIQYFNGFGGFNGTGDEYIIRLTEKMSSPAPWVNIIANPNFGTLTSECGQGFTWIDNAHEFRLSPWNNDPLLDSAGEAFYLRDEESGIFWSPTALPCRGQGDYYIRHGFGYSVFEHSEEGIYSELSMTVALDAPIKFVILKVRNDSDRLRRLSVTGYVEWVLGDLRVKNAMHVITELAQSGAILAYNHYNTEFAERIAFFDAATPIVELNSRTITGDRTEFIGRNGSLGKPNALDRKRLSGRVGAGLDPCAAIQLSFDLARNQSREIVFILGAGKNHDEVEALLHQYHGISAAESALASVRKYWKQNFSALRIDTPNLSLNFLANGWLVYQLLSSRLWGRTGFYQSSGAFGFRDQLQDVMALTHVAPLLYRQHLLLCAAHQFEEGDVQHWWHPSQNRGVRTRCSDDYLWLPFALCHYIEGTGDKEILDEAIHFLQGRPLNVGEESYYEIPNVSNEKYSLYQHAVRAINHGLRFGVHGLPLMGSGDWNDGMNLVGSKGHGESVWLGFFFYSVLKHFIPVAENYGDSAFAEKLKEVSIQLQNNIEEHGWDGEWYRRAYFDDGTPLGSSLNEECKIDSIAQSWSVLSKAASPERAQQAMRSAMNHLVNSEEELIKLLTPPFDKSKPSPGYIQAYVPGIRENGGQYTHAAVWAAMALAELGNKDKAWELFNILDPVNHARTVDEISRYKIEPYVVAADIYSNPQHVGRGGWSWYTGSAGWLYRLITEVLLGIKLEKGNQLRLTPNLPKDWNGFSVNYAYGKNGRTLYKITVKRSEDSNAHLEEKEQKELGDLGRMRGLSGLSGYDNISEFENISGVSGISESFHSRGQENKGYIWIGNEKIIGNTIPLIDDGKEHEVFLFSD